MSCIQQCVFIRHLSLHQTYERVCVDVVVLQVDYVEPWLAGNARGPSTAFCLLYRLFELKPTEEELEATITHEDSTYIKAVRAS
jgi:pre-mRNA-splicing factor 38B